MSSSFLVLVCVVCCGLYLILQVQADVSSGFVPKVSRRGQNAEGTEKWAYVDVRPQAHMFYWLYYTYHPDGAENRPWILWLQGGPGASSCGYGNFELIGPLDLNLNPRNTTWVNQASVLFVDNPVGAGYSYVDNETALTTDVQQITTDLIVVLKAVLDESPEFATRPFYIFGQSYGGKMGAHVARQLYDEILMGNIRLSLMGFAMGNAWISPIDSTLTWGGLLYWMSLVDEQGHDAIQRAAEQTEVAVNEGRWFDATRLWRATQSVVLLRSHYVDFYNILKFNTPSSPGSSGYDKDFGKSSTLRSSDFGFLYRKMFPNAKADPLDDLMNGVIREKLGIIPDDVIWGGQYNAVFRAQEGDFMKPVVSVVDSALSTTALNVIIYQGQLDLICDTMGTMDWVQQLTWNQLGNYNGATRKAFERDTDGQTEMYVKAFNRFKFYWVLEGGHSIAKDNGPTAYKMFERILGNMDV